MEIDLGAVFKITDVFVTLSEQVFLEPCQYMLSLDGLNFSGRTDSGRARYVRVYGATGVAEIEVFGESNATSNAVVDISMSASEGYRITSAEQGVPITATVFDLSGRSVWSNTSNTGELLWNRCSSSGNTVPAGVYLIMVESDDIETFTSKVVVR